jgi:hypothetical protein
MNNSLLNKSLFCFENICEKRGWRGGEDEDDDDELGVFCLKVLLLQKEPL